VSELKNHTKRAVAYIAGRIISERDIATIYDDNQAKHFRFSGDVEPDLAIFDYERRCYINGSRNGNAVYIRHFGNKNNIDLEITGHDFVGYDYDSRQRFGGNVNENLITLYDYEDNHNYTYQIKLS
jgi:hypothetical protein